MQSMPDACATVFSARYADNFADFEAFMQAGPPEIIRCVGQEVDDHVWRYTTTFADGRTEKVREAPHRYQSLAQLAPASYDAHLPRFQRRGELRWSKRVKVTLVGSARKRLLKRLLIEWPVEYPPIIRRPLLPKRRKPN
jgi:hypothetical protein